MPTDRLSWFAQEDALAESQFQAFGQPCQLDNGLLIEAIIDKDIGIPDDSGFIKERRTEVTIAANIEVGRGTVVTEQSGRAWHLMRLAANDGIEQTWVATPAGGQ